MKEAEFQANIIQLAKTLGWLVHHDRGDYTQCIGGDPGFPDLVLAKQGRVIFLELKSDSGRTTRAQDDWMDATGALLVRPSDIEYIAYLLGPNYEPSEPGRNLTSTQTS